MNVKQEFPASRLFTPLQSTLSSSQTPLATMKFILSLTAFAAATVMAMPHGAHDAHEPSVYVRCMTCPFRLTDLLY
jgi:hypothetical protein